MRFTNILRLMLGLAICLPWGGHAAKKDGGFIVYPGAPGSPGPVVFSHLSHGARKAGYDCAACHAAAAVDTIKVTMDEIRQGRACGACHDGRVKGPRGRSAAAPVEDCQTCHMPAADVVIALKRMDPVPFSHVSHLGVVAGKKLSKPAGFSCGDCHPAPFDLAARGSSGMQLPHDRGGCAQCHNGRKRRDGLPVAFAANTRCLACHKPPEPPSAVR
ncbi:MAG: c(7)-type cytochrome triheme domain-containing protein [Bryobacteraceae bacterium]